MYRRVVFIGLGGSGGKTLRFLKRDLRHWLTEHNWPESREIPEGFQFLHIDTPTVQDGAAMRGADMLPDREYLGLVGPGINFSNVVTQLDNRIGIQEEFAGWRVPPPLPVPINAGAGAFRAVGRTIALAYMDQIRVGVKSVLDRVSGNRSVSELTELWRLVNNNQQPAGENADPLVFVVSSLAGGTGAGLLMDVFDVVRSLESWGDNSFGILYTPEVFASIGGGLMNGIQPNSLAAISEILNGHYWHGVHQGINAQNIPTEIGLKNPKTLQTAGVVGAITRSGPAYPYLVGSTNGAGVHFTSDKEVFETIGSALVAWCVDPVAQDQLIAFSFANWADRANQNQSQNDLLINRGTPQEQGIPAFNAIGCSRVSVGTRYLERYSAQRIARDAATYMAGYHMESDEARGLMASLNTNKPQEIAKAIAESKYSWFIKQAKLRERGPEENDIIDALRPSEYGSIYGSAMSSATQLADIGKASSQAYVESATNAVRNSLLSFDAEVRPLIERNVKGWTETKPEEVISVVEEAIANFGFAVTIEILERLIYDFSNPIDGICSELMGEKEHKMLSEYASESSWGSQITAVLSNVRGNFTMQSNERVGEAISAAFQYGHNIAEAQIREQASNLLNEFVKGFVIPLKRSIADASILLDRHLEEITGWPTWTDGLPPEDSTPPSSEYTLIEPENFSSVFLDTLSKSVGGDQLEKTAHRANVRSSIISGGFLREMGSQSSLASAITRPSQAIQVSQKWNPGSGVVRDSQTPKADVVVALKYAPSDLQNRARMWLRRPNTAFDDLLKSTLRTYTTGDAVFNSNVHVSASEYEERRTKFITQLQRATTSSAPLVELDAALHQAIHPVRPFNVQFSSFPFIGHALQNDVLNVIRPLAGGDGAQDDQQLLRRFFVSDSSIESIQIMSFLNGAHYPFLFSSLLEPIGQRWSRENATQHQRSQFWSKRRARLLGEFIPAPQEHIIALIRGWFTGRLLGLIDVPRNGENRAVRISQPWSLESGAVNFPYPMLTSPTSAGDELFAVLESLSLAYVMVGQENNLLPLRPYISLRDMGRMLLDERMLHYDNANPLIKSWITNGTLSTSFDNRTKDETAIRTGLNSEMHQNLRDVSGGEFNPENRKQALVGLLEQVLSQYSSDAESYWDNVTLNRSSLNNPPYWPSIRTTSDTPDILVTALQSLISGVRNVNTKPVTGV